MSIKLSEEYSLISRLSRDISFGGSYLALIKTDRLTQKISHYGTLVVLGAG